MDYTINLNNEIIEVPIGRNKLAGVLLTGLAVLSCSVWCMVAPSAYVARGEDSNRYHYRSDIIILGIIFTAIFVPYVIFTLYKILKFKPGLVIDGNGIYENSRFSSLGFIAWEDISAIKIVITDPIPCIRVYINHPKEIINGTGGFIKSKLLKRNYLQYGTPIIIATEGLKCNMNELYQVLTNRLNEYKGLPGD